MYWGSSFGANLFRRSLARYERTDSVTSVFEPFSNDGMVVMVVVVTVVLMVVVTVVVMMIGRKYIACRPRRPAESEQSLLEGGPRERRARGIFG